jgi:hypothetical protein
LEAREEELRQVRQQAREELDRHRQKARELATQQEAQIHVLHSKLKGLHLPPPAQPKEEPLQQQPSRPSTPAAATSASSAPAEGNVSAMAAADGSSGSVSPADANSAADFQLAALSASRDEELARCRTHIRQLQDLLRTSELQGTALRERESALQRQLAEQSRMAQRSQELSKQDSYEYLKNVLIKYIETGDESLINVLTTLLKLSPEEANTVRQKRNSHKSGYFGLFG